MVGGGEHEDHARGGCGRRDIDGDETGVGDGGRDERDVEGTRQVDVGHERRVADEEVGVLDAPDGGADERPRHVPTRSAYSGWRSM